MATKPTKFPDWATTLENDVTSGQPNRDEPPVDKRESGYDFEESPPRQWINWKFWNISEWVRWFENKISGLGTMALEATGDYGKLSQANTWSGTQTIAANGSDQLHFERPGQTRQWRIQQSNGINSLIFSRRDSDGTNLGAALRLSEAGLLQVENGINIDGANIRRVLTGTRSVTGSDFSPHSTITITLTVSGAFPGDVVIVSPDDNIDNQIHITAGWVSATNEVTYKYVNTSGSNRTMNNHAVRCWVIKA